MINFHTDTSLKTLQLSLNDDGEYEGGKLVYATKQSLVQPKRGKGTVTVHDNKIVHGVTLLKSGVRYGLFFLNK
jgi:predicted 2-oxoglutarate/Fe(II)-dependent dioxygenase YbiX